MRSSENKKTEQFSLFCFFIFYFLFFIFFFLPIVFIFSIIGQKRAHNTYSGLTLNQYGVASPCRTICTVYGFVALS